MDKMLATLTLKFPPGELLITQKALVAIWALKFEVSHRILSFDDNSLGGIARTRNHPKMNSRNVPFGLPRDSTGSSADCGPCFWGRNRSDHPDFKWCQRGNSSSTGPNFLLAFSHCHRYHCTAIRKLKSFSKHDLWM